MRRPIQPACSESPKPMTALPMTEPASSTSGSGIGPRSGSSNVATGIAPPETKSVTYHATARIAGEHLVTE